MGVETMKNGHGRFFAQTGALQTLHLVQRRLRTLTR
jgi:hypothetical protein